MVSKVFSTYQAAKNCNVHHTTIINWIKEGKLKAYITPGGHRRIKKEDLIEFMKKYQMPIPEEIKKARKTILIVDDDVELLEELKSALSHLEVELIFAVNGFEAGMKVFSKRPDLILLDFKLPGMDGFEVCELLHEEKETARIPIIAITVLKSAEDQELIKKYGVVKYMPKPIDVSKLLKWIEDMLNINIQ
ncbi:MAG: response regulator [Candidatus Omnitrophota bacterium]